jgi:hypothetical protein
VPSLLGRRVRSGRRSLHRLRLGDAAHGLLCGWYVKLASFAPLWVSYARKTPALLPNCSRDSRTPMLEKK